MYTTMWVILYHSFVGIRYSDILLLYACIELVCFG